MSIKITECTVTKIKSQSKIRAYAKITIDECFVVTSLKVIDGEKGLFVAMPSTKNPKTNEYNDICFPINKETRELIQSAVLKAYKTEEDPF